ncbi:MAG: type II toxin-antitoxin system VapC family toxin [Candidatus Saccharimonadales bacterium]
MNGLLLDSHVFLWLLYAPDKIGAKAKIALRDADSVYVSVVSLWELTLKFDKGKLAYPPAELIKGVDALNATLLPLQPAHLLELPKIKLTHQDPFDRLLLAQSKIEKLDLLTADTLLLKSAYTTQDVRQ